MFSSAGRSLFPPLTSPGDEFMSIRQYKSRSFPTIVSFRAHRQRGAKVFSRTGQPHRGSARVFAPSFSRTFHLRQYLPCSGLCGFLAFYTFGIQKIYSRPEGNKHDCKASGYPCRRNAMGATDVLLSHNYMTWYGNEQLKYCATK